jgi:2-polyprenyl-3-methyl-5-hydroxy-6-metoxy-1,4-benzoquinol methylase
MLDSFSFSNESYSKNITNDVYTDNKMVAVRKVISNLPEKGRILDVGCFNGFVLGLIRQKGEYDLYGVDASEKAVSHCNSIGLNVTNTNLEKPLPFDNDYFDAVIGLEIIEHLADTDFFLEEIKRILKPKGTLILTTPNAVSLPRRVLTLIGISPFFEASFTFPPNMAGHLRFFTPKLLKGLLETRGYRVSLLESDVINFSNDGNFYSTILANIFPNLGRGIIVTAKKS